MSRHYKIRFFFEYGFGCLWSGDDFTRELFGYPIHPEKLHLSESTLRQIQKLEHWFQTSLNWESPRDGSPWSVDERDRFITESKQLFEIITVELGDNFEVDYEQVWSD